MQDCKPDIVAATAACDEVRKSRKFAKILEIILLIGNIMNTGSKNAQSVGFDMSYLPKVREIFMRIGLLGGAGYANDGQAGYFFIFFLHKVFPRTTKTTIVLEFRYSEQCLTQLNILPPLLDVDLNHWQQYLFRYVF